MKLMILLLSCALFSVAICQNDVQFDEDFFEPIKGSFGPCNYWGNPNHYDSLDMVDQGLSRTNIIFGDSIHNENLFNLINSIESDIIYIHRGIGPWERASGAVLHFLDIEDNHYYLIICTQDKVNLDCNHWDPEHFNENFDELKKVKNFDFYLYTGKIDNYINYLRKNIDWTSDDISRIDSLHNEMRMRKNIINDK